MSNTNITIHDIARLLKISPSTVSRALNDNPRISLATRESVKNMAFKEGYQPNHIASFLRKGKTKTAGVIVPRINRSFFSNVIGGIEEILASAGYSLTICQSSENYEKEIQNLKVLSNLRVDGIIMSLSVNTPDNNHLKELIDKGMSLVMFDRIAEDLNISSVKLDDLAGASEAVNHLINQGYSRIAHFSGPSHLNVYRDRKEGYLKALRNNGLPINEQLIIPECLTKDKGIEACRYLLNLKEKPDAIFSASDFSAIGAMITLLEKGHKIPQDIGIVGFANEPFTEFVTPSITTVDQKSAEMGKLTAKIFLDSINGIKSDKVLEKIVLKPKLIIRESSRKLVK